MTRQAYGRKKLDGSTFAGAKNIEATHMFSCSILFLYKKIHEFCIIKILMPYADNHSGTMHFSG
jgi:hypothetical protein